MGKLIKKADIVNRKFMHKLYTDNSVNTGEPFHYAFPYDLAVELFGVEASDFMYEVSQGLCCSYITDLMVLDMWVFLVLN